MVRSGVTRPRCMARPASIISAAMTMSTSPGVGIIDEDRRPPALRDHLDVVERRPGALRDARHRGRLHVPAIALAERDQPVGDDAAALPADRQDRNRDRPLASDRVHGRSAKELDERLTRSSRSAEANRPQPHPPLTRSPLPVPGRDGALDQPHREPLSAAHSRNGLLPRALDRRSNEVADRGRHPSPERGGGTALAVGGAGGCKTLRSIQRQKYEEPSAVARNCEREQCQRRHGLLRDGEAEAFGGAAALQVADDAGAEARLRTARRRRDCRRGRCGRTTGRAPPRRRPRRNCRSRRSSRRSPPPDRRGADRRAS